MPLQRKPSIVFVHGLWADGSCFSKLIPTLQNEGFEVIASQHGLDSHAGDVDCVKRTLGRVSNPAILVGHSYGGSVITAAGTDPRVAALVYLAAFAPDADETTQSLQEKFPATDIFSHIEVADGRVWLKRDGVSSFAGDLPEERAEADLGHSGRACSRFVQSEGGRYCVEIEAELVRCSYEGPYDPARVGAFRREAYGSNSLRDR